MLEVECEMPNSNLHNFRGRASIRQAPGDPGKILPITMNQMLLRGCMLKNSYSVLGLVVYTGKDTRIQMNSASAPLKIGSFDHFLNMQVCQPCVPLFSPVLSLFNVCMHGCFCFRLSGGLPCEQKYVLGAKLCAVGGYPHHGASRSLHHLCSAQLQLA